MDTLRSPFSIQPLSPATSSTNSTHPPPPPPPQPSPPKLADVPPKPSLTLENPAPTTFIQADASSFRHVVQSLTGLPETPGRSVAKSAASALAVNESYRLPTSVKKTNSFKLYERRQKNLRKLKLGGFGELQSGGGGGGVNYPGEIPSPSSLDFTELTLSPVTPLVSNTFVVAAAEEEEKAIAAKGFYLHPSPLSTPRDGSSPRLLSLFPLTSPR